MRILIIEKIVTYLGNDFDNIEQHRFIYVVNNYLELQNDDIDLIVKTEIIQSMAVAVGGNENVIVDWLNNLIVCNGLQFYFYPQQTNFIEQILINLWLMINENRIVEYD